MQKKPFTVQVLGTSFSIQTDEDAEYLERIQQIYRDKVHQIQKNIPIEDPLKTSILAGILIIDDLIKLQKNRSPDTELMKAEELTLRMIERIDTILDED